MCLKAVNIIQFLQNCGTTMNSTHELSNLSIGKVVVDECEHDMWLQKSTEVLYSRAYGIALPVICAIGFCGNLLSLIVLTRCLLRNKKNITFLFLLCMAISDLFSVLFWVPEMARLGFIRHLDQVHEVLTFYYAHVSSPCINISMTTSDLFVVAVTIERYICICHPIKSKKWVTLRLARITVISVYIVTALVYAPSAFEYKVINYVAPDNITTPRKQWNPDFSDTIYYSQMYKWIRVGLFKFAPILAVIFFNMLIFFGYRAFSKRHARLISARSATENKEKQLIPLLFALSSLFAICITPVAIYHLTVNSLNRQDYAYRVFIVFADCLEVCNSALNFFVYCVASSEFRKHFRETFSCSRCSKTKINTKRAKSRAAVILQIYQKERQRKHAETI